MKTTKTTKLFKNDIILLCALEGLMKISDESEKEDERKWAIPSASWLMKHIRMSRATLYRSLKRLIEKEYVIKKTIVYQGHNLVGHWVDTKKIEQECQKIIDENKNEHSENYITRKNEHAFIKLKYSYLVLSAD